MRKFLTKTLLFFSILLLVLAPVIVFYFLTDPFRVLYHYDDFIKTGEPAHVDLNNDYVAIETFNHQLATWHYDSFIIGNSRTRFYEVEHWQPYIASDRTFHFDASSESLYGILKKAEYLDKKQVRISNVLLVLDYTILSQVQNSDKYLFVKHPALSGENILSFQLIFFKAFLSPKFLFAYAWYKMTGKTTGYVEKTGILTYAPIDYDKRHNQMKLSRFEKTIRANPSDFYTEKRLKNFYPREDKASFSLPLIKDEQLKMLQQVNAIFIKNKTRYRIVISPLYDQLRINAQDLKILKDVFGEANVFDFSGQNAITADYRNYYEASHYRPQVADSIMKWVYSNY